MLAAALAPPAGARPRRAGRSRRPPPGQPADPLGRWHPGAGGPRPGRAAPGGPPHRAPLGDGRHGRWPRARPSGSARPGVRSCSPATGDPALPAGSALLPWNLPGRPRRRSDRRRRTVYRDHGARRREVTRVGDPVFDHGLDLAVWIILLVKVVAVFVIVMVSVLFMVMYERKAVARLGVRYGPNRAGPNGWLQSLADGTKLLFKEAFAPRGADKVVYRVAPYLMLFPALLVFAIVPDRRHHHRRRSHHPPPAGRPALGDPVPADDVGHLGLRRDAGGLGVGIEISAARFGSGQRPAGVLRGRSGLDGDHGRPGDRIASHQRHRGRPARRVPQSLELPAHPADPERPLHHRHHGRDDPAAIRSGRGRGGALRRLQPRVLVDRLRLVLPGRVRRPGHQLGDHRDPVVRRSGRAAHRRQQHRAGLVRRQGADPALPLRLGAGHPAPSAL